ncbi:MAG: YgiT-type zinc finger protein [Anaerolineae bacterium]|nr:YgiT-type zinc finger protein [Anaerolineae bacterium]
MEWVHCRGQLVKKKVNYPANRKGYHLIIDDVPAWVGRQGGEPMFGEATVAAIQEMLPAMDNRQKLMALAA